ncbi:hypothetical protein BRARA_C01698 [Brassica rapa]|uniref:Myosin motor domain-containing protein n=1 Tax=Brassica campestris TaxID=3711 RepID=A0A397ZVM6_BRACM|nr:hypothetical protein BRARA_C01698 [Brassica rapa]
MTKLAYLHEPGVLLNLKARYNANEIYTYTGNILIAVNPFKRLPHLYGNDIMEQYKGSDFGELSPHPFAVADSAYRKMINEGVSQAILVSGESGAGKTESTKMLMQYLAFMGGKAQTEGRSVEQQVLESNPVLEAFGNAKTVKNNNSSRFGKFVEIQFNHMGRISGAAIRTYLLERSRVCQVSDPERNYHCFYMLCAAPEQEIERYKLGEPSTFHYLNQSNCYSLSALDDAKEYLATRKAMEVVGISSEEQDAIFRTVAAILHLGNIEFEKGEEADAAEPKDDKSRFHLKVAAELFMCDEKALEDSLCKRVMVTRGESITKSLDPGSAALSRDALAKIPTSFFGRMTQGFRSPSSGSLSGDVVQQVDAKVPALLFKQQLTAYVETIYGIVQENVKRELEPVLLSCIQGLKDSSNEPSSDDLPAQSSEQNSPAKSSEQNSPAKPSEDKIPPEKLPEGSSPEKPSEEEDPHAKISEENTPAKPSADNAPEETWQGIIDLLNRLLGTLQKNYVPLFLAQKIFSQTFQGINVQVFNSLMQQECCTFNMGKRVNAFLNELEAWCSLATEEFVGSSWDELKHTRQAVGILVTEQKSTITYDDLTTNLCPALSTQQLYRICTLCKIDDDKDQNVSPDVVSNLKLLITDEDEDSRSFSLDNDSSIPFAADEISNCMQEKEFTNVKAAIELADNPNFHFLKD